MIIVIKMHAQGHGAEPCCLRRDVPALAESAGLLHGGFCLQSFCNGSFVSPKQTALWVDFLKKALMAIDIASGMDLGIFPPFHGPSPTSSKSSLLKIWHMIFDGIHILGLDPVQSMEQAQKWK